MEQIMWIKDIKGQLIKVDSVKRLDIYEYHVGHRLDNPIENYSVQAVVPGIDDRRDSITLAKMKTEKDAQDYIANLGLRTGGIVNTDNT